MQHRLLDTFPVTCSASSYAPDVGEVLADMRYLLEMILSEVSSDSQVNQFGGVGQFESSVPGTDIGVSIGRRDIPLKEHMTLEQLANFSGLVPHGSRQWEVWCCSEQGAIAYSVNALPLRFVAVSFGIDDPSSPQSSDLHVATITYDGSNISRGQLDVVDSKVRNDFSSRRVIEVVDFVRACLRALLHGPIHTIAIAS